MENIIKILRGNKSQKEFAKQVGISQQSMANYEAGRWPKPEILNRIAGAAGKKITIVIEDLEETAKTE